MTTTCAFDPDRLVRLGRVTAAVPSPCGTWAAAAVSRLDTEGGKFVSDLWRVPLDGGGEPVQLTRGDSDDRAPCFRRDGALGFLSNRNPRPAKPEEGDDERSQVWILPHTGEPVPLTDEPLGVTAFRFAAEGDRLLVVADVLLGVPHEEQRKHAADRKKNGPSALRFTRMPVRYWDHWLGPTAPHLIAYDERGEGRRDLTPEADREHREPEWDLSRDGRWAVITTASLAADRMEDLSLLLIDLETDERRLLHAEPLTRLFHPLFSPDGRRIACVRSPRPPEALGKPELRVFDLAGGEGRPLAAVWDRWPNPQAWTEDGAALLVTADDQGAVPVFRVDAATGGVTRLSSETGGGVHEGLSVVRGRDLAVGVRHRTFHPPEPFRIALEAGAEPELLAALSGLTEAEGAALAACETLVTRAEDGTEVRSLVVRPAAHDLGQAPLPTLLWIHGGPLGQWSHGWQWRWNPLAAVARGYVVVLPNPRGSTGCGQEMIEQIRADWGGRCYRDLMAVADDVERLPYVDERRVAAMGGSFGGYMTNWIGGNTDRFRCLVTHASLFSLPMFHGTTDFPPWFARHVGAFPWDDPETVDRYSPHTRLANWKTPTLIIHGEKDYRVPIGESLALFEGLQHHGVPSELLVFPDENHWILKPRNIEVWYRTVLEFLDRHLR
jgi:dipeptidyl aminopeptidase/acylaminoacyl peptidase